MYPPRIRLSPCGWWHHRVIDVPATVRNKALAAGATQWIEDLPALIAGLERDWSLTVGRPYDDATEAFVAAAALDDGTPAVVKVLVPQAIDVTGDASRNEATVLRLTATAAYAC